MPECSKKHWRKPVRRVGERADKKAAARRETISGDIILSGKLAARTQPDDLLFVFARTTEGSRMPLAVLRLRVADLPFSFRLDDSMALPGGQKISDFDAVGVEARIAKSGKAQTASGLFVRRRQECQTRAARTVNWSLTRVQP